MKVKDVIRKGTVCCVFAVAPLTMTGCSFEFKNVKDYGIELPAPLQHQIDGINAFKDVLSVIDEADIGKDMTDSEFDALFDDVLGEADKVSEKLDMEFVRATLVRVVDGDTIVVSIDGEEQKVRLIGIDTPESVASKEYLERTGKENTEAGRTASEHTKDILKNVKELWLQKDVSDTDRYGRALRYVWLEKPEDKEDIVEISTKMLNAVLIKDGYAEIATYPPDTHYKKDFEYIYKMSHEDGYDDHEY